MCGIDGQTPTFEFTFEGLQRALANWQIDYPEVVQPPIGYSVLGQPLQLFKVGTGHIHLHMNAAMHANEWLTAFALIAWGRRWTEQWQTFFPEYTLWLVPLVNPDGVQLVMSGSLADPACMAKVRAMNGESMDFSNWKANARGVDLNDQFPAGWRDEYVRRSEEREACGQTYAPGARDYCGVEPLSEPEAVALVEFVRRQSFSTVIALHSQGEEIYWNYRGFEPDGAELMAQTMAAASGYRAVRLAESDAGFKDWFIEQFRKPGFTIELGYGQNPLPVEQLATICDKLEHILFAFLSNEKHD